MSDKYQKTMTTTYIERAQAREEREQLIARIPKRLKERFRAKCKREGQTITLRIEELIIKDLMR